MKKTLIMVLFFFWASGVGYPQSPDWTLPPNNLHLSTSIVSPLPGGSFTTPYYGANCGYDAAGSILFYVVDGKIYNNTGIHVGSLTPLIGYNSKDIIIIPDPADCNAHLVLHTSTDLIVSSGCSYVTQLLCTKITHVGSVLTIQQYYYPVSNYNFNTCNRGVSMCVSQPKSNGSRFLYIAGDTRVYKYTVGNTGINQVNSFNTGSNNYPTDLELSPTGDKVAFANAAGGSAYSIKWVNLDANGDFIGVLNQMDASPSVYPAYGLEFIDNSRVLVAAGNGSLGGIYLAQLTGIPSSTQVVSNGAYANSHLEMGLNGKVYAASSTGLLGVNTSTFATNTITLAITSNLVQSFGFGHYALPKQLDYENYANVFACILPCPPTITITGTYTAPLTEASLWINTAATTTIPTGSTVKLDANNTSNNGYIELNAGFETQTGSVFIAQALDGCGPNIPMRIAQGNTNEVLVKPVTQKSITILGLTVYPNPATGIITLKYPVNTKLLQLYDMTGKLIIGHTGNKNGITEMNISMLTPGSYFLTADNRFRQKIIKQ
jgi:hypothetical protein